MSTTETDIAVHHITSIVTAIAEKQGLNAKNIDHQIEIEKITGRVLSTYSYAFDYVNAGLRSSVHILVNPQR